MFNTDPLSLITRLVGLLAFGIFLSTQLTVFGHVRGINYQMSGGDRQKDPLAGKRIEVTNTREDYNRKLFKRSYVATIRQDDIEAGRTVSFDAVVPVSALLAPGESVPAKEFEGVFAETRAVFYAQEECQRLVAALAASCEVGHASGKIRDGEVKISATLNFTQRAEFGELDRQTAWVFNTASVNMTGGTTTLPQSRAERKRADYYRKAAKECAAIKERAGNCAITAIRIYTRQQPQSRQVVMSASAEYGFLTRTSQVGG